MVHIRAGARPCRKRRLHIGVGTGSYPSQPVKIIVQAPAGNGPDVLARIVAEHLGQLWGQQVLILNRPGAGGLIAAQAAASAQPDGYTLYMPSSSTFLVLPARHAKLPFDLDRDFARIGMVAQSPLVIAAAPSLGINTVAELIARAKERPGDIMYAALGRGTLPHATSELFQRRAGIELRYVSYGGPIRRCRTSWEAGSDSCSTGSEHSPARSRTKPSRSSPRRRRNGCHTFLIFRQSPRPFPISLR